VQDVADVTGLEAVVGELDLELVLATASGGDARGGGERDRVAEARVDEDRRVGAQQQVGGGRDPQPAAGVGRPAHEAVVDLDLAEQQRVDGERRGQRRRSVWVRVLIKAP
jgi:hypothetical protein